MNPYSLALTLGHNSSAILIESGHILCGYENERITGIKADSQFPEQAIMQIGTLYDLNQVRDVYISHWEILGDLSKMSHKHWQKFRLVELCPNANVILSCDHHDAHVYALRAFAGKTYDWEIVADGFGNWGEVFSIYNKGQLRHRAFGFEKSLGLLYQYATAFLGMKMNQDEYKLLGYEAKITSCFRTNVISLISDAAARYAKKVVRSIIDCDINPEYDAIAGLEALPNIRMKIQDKLTMLCSNVSKMYGEKIDPFRTKVVVAFFVQRVVENVMRDIVKFFGMTNLGLSGGLFMNVKLNNTLLNMVDEVCILPICGDQGAGLGVYNHYKEDLVWPTNLFWGQRQLKVVEADKVSYFKDFRSIMIALMHSLSRDLIVNVVCGDMEFGPRALGHTSTFALPTINNVNYINKLNGRDTIMPMAGMISEDIIDLYYNNKKVHKSLEYMITTLVSQCTPNEAHLGCHHSDPILSVWTNRVQLVTKDNKFYPLLKQYGSLINTSFNRHGVPILFTMDQIIETHQYQCERDDKDRMVTLILV